MIVEITLGVLLAITSYTTFNQLRKVERLESWIEDYAQRVIDTQKTLREIYNKGNFEPDDEVGVVIDSIKESIDELNQITQKEL